MIEILESGNQANITAAQVIASQITNPISGQITMRTAMGESVSWRTNTRRGFFGLVVRMVGRWRDVSLISIGMRFVRD